MIKRVLAALAITAAALSLSACAGPVHRDGVEAKPYGFFNEATAKSNDPRVKYQVSAGSVIVALIFSETVIVPLYVIGWDLFEPVVTN